VIDHCLQLGFYKKQNSDVMARLDEYEQLIQNQSLEEECNRNSVITKYVPNSLI